METIKELIAKTTQLELLRILNDDGVIDLGTYIKYFEMIVKADKALTREIKKVAA